jgi:acyl-CoA synthetase (AMP-forming)/AMP-acid ligase II
MILEGAGAAPSTISYRVLAEKARGAARGLRELNIAAGDRVAIMLPTGEAFVTAFFGALYAGAIPVPIYPPARAAQIEDHLRRQASILANAGATMLIAPPALRTAAGLLHSLVESLSVVTSVDELPDSAETALPRIDQPGDTALLQYTSGSTGAPKGVVMSHANLLANIRALGMAMGASAADVFVSWLPFYHNMGLIGAWLGSLYFAAPLVVMLPQSFLLRPECWLWAIHRHRGTLSAAPNFAFELCLRNIEDSAIEGLDLSSLRLVANGSEPVSATTLRRFLDRFGRYGFRPEAMAPAYGLAESAVALTLPPRGRPPVIDRIMRRALTESGIAEPVLDQATAIELVSCGAPLPGHEIRVVDETEHEPGDRREGRLQFRGPSATRGYFRDAAKTRELFSGDWLESGDLGYIAGGNCSSPAAPRTSSFAPAATSTRARSRRRSGRSQDCRRTRLRCSVVMIRAQGPSG